MPSAVYLLDVMYGMPCITSIQYNTRFIQVSVVACAA